MSAPRYEILQKHIQNPHASFPLTVPILVLCNTSDEDLERNIRQNSARELEWLHVTPETTRPAIMVGGGPSAAEFVEDIRTIKDLRGGLIFAINGASKWLGRHGIVADYQVMADAKPETASLVDLHAKAHLFASQVNERTMLAAPNPILWHLDLGDIERFFPAERVRKGGYCLLGGGAATGNSALCVAYAMGFREMHIFGYDSSHKAGASHAYPQAMNAMIPTVDVEWAGKTYTTSVAMKAQAEKFQMTSQALKQEGCDLHVYGDGLLQHIYTTPPEHMTERDKYRLLWQFDTYREVAPGEHIVDLFLKTAEPQGLVLDFGCGTGRAALRIREAGLDVLAIDFADNCRDHEALELPFLEWDLTRPLPARAHYGFCTDVMEHIPAQDTETVLANLFEAAPRVFFQIDTEPDVCGALIGQSLHINIRPHDEWAALLGKFGALALAHDNGGSSIFYVIKE